jgi:hypothetical protein
VFVGGVELSSLGIHPLHQLKTSLRTVGKDVEGEEFERLLAVLPIIVVDGSDCGCS